MRPFLLACLVALAAARPEPPVGYSYQAPLGGQSHGGGSLSGGALGGGGIQYASNGGYSYSSGGNGGLLNGGGNEGYSQLSGGHGGLSNGGGLSFGGHGGGLSFGGGDNGGFGGHSTGGNGGGFEGGLSYAPQAPTVHKHVYVHVAPEEPEDRRPPQHIPVAAPQKHYKIIFIKAPSPPAPTAPVIPVQPQNEEKTLVYVLVKKPEEQPELVLPQAAPTQPSKPEVFFIRYKTQKEQSHGGAINGGGADFQGPSGIDASAPGSGAVANNGLEGLSHGPSSLDGPAHGPSSFGGSSFSAGGPSSVGGDLGGADHSFSSGGNGGGVSYIPPPSGGHSSGGASSKYGPPGYHK